MRQRNFSGGPGALPPGVEEAASRALLNVPEVGLPLLGISHRSAWFADVVAEAESLVRKLIGLPEGTHVLFLQGGATLQFSTVAATLLRREPGRFGDYLETGYWSQKSLPEARKEGEVRVAWSGAKERFRRLPSTEETRLSADAAYLHYVSNETVEGLQFHQTPGREGVRRVCDMSSDFLSRPIDPSKFAIVYAHAQKNLGPAGVTLVIVDDKVLSEVPEGLPAMMDYRLHAERHSIYNTPPTFAIYVILLVLRWLDREIGGLAAMDAINREKARRVYEVLDATEGFYVGHARPEDRSLMNVAFNLPTPELEREFAEAARKQGLYGLEGHRSLGGLRASLYNAVSLEGVDALTDFMLNFWNERRTLERRVEAIA